ncbi:Alkaline serine protease Alp1 [Pyrenophora tritici-repentis]|nr:Alkaline serine protease Alp1 [Pyrenophora tritici-repentis]
MLFFTRVTAFVAAAAPFFANAAPVAAEQRTNEVIPGKYIVQLRSDADVAAVAAHHNKVRDIYARNLARRGDDGSAGGAPVEREYGFGEFKAYAGSFDEATVEELRGLPEVISVEQNFIMRSTGFVTQASAPWGLGSISSRTPGSTSYVYDDSAGKGTFSYVIDTGVRITHNEFEGRAIWGFNAVSGSPDTDDDGHGTHVAGTLGGKTYGVAKKTTIIAVKALAGDTGSASDVFAAFDWTVNDIVAKNRQNTSVINMSLGSSASSTWDAAITAAWNKGVLVATTAGNENSLASERSPARSPEVICVGNVRIDNQRLGGPGGSNYGDAVDIFAAGTNVLSADMASDSATRVRNGTSMASPHVAGLVSYLRGLEGPLSARDVKARVYALATPGVVTDTMGSANLLAYNGNK